MAGFDTPITQIKGIGKKTAENFRRKIRKSRPTSKIGETPTVSEVSKHSGIAEVVFSINQKEALRNAGARVSFTTEERQRQNRKAAGQRESNPGKTQNVGDFRVLNAERKEAWETHQDRTAMAQELDEERRARITTDVDKWQSDPNSFDFPGIDTPSRKPRREEKDRPFVNESMLLRPFDDEPESKENGERTQENRGSGGSGFMPAGNPPNPAEVEGSVMVRNRKTDDLFTVTESNQEGEIFFENRENRDTFVGSLDQLRKFYEPVDS